MPVPRLDRRRANPEPANLVGKRVREVRLLRGKSQDALASAVQDELNQIFPGMPLVIDQSDISRLESGKRPVWDYELRALALALTVSADFLLGVAGKA